MSDNLSILFIGNSFTFANDLDIRVKEMAKSAGIEIQTARVAHGGYRLHQYTDDSAPEYVEVETLLNSRKWTYVVLQDHSQGPIKESNKFYFAATQLCKRIRNIGATPVFYETWAYRPNSEKMNSVGMSYNEMHVALQEAYRKAAKENNTFSVPVGEAFKKMLELENGPDPLWTVDDYHPCFCGTYLAATMFCLRLIPNMKETDYCPVGNEPFSKEDVKVCFKIAKEVLGLK